MKKFNKKNIAELARFATAMTGSKDEGNDLVSSAIEKILTKYPDVKDSTEFLKLTYTIIRREYIDIKRKKKREFSIEDLGNNSNDNSLDNNDVQDYIEYKAGNLDEEFKIKTRDTEEEMIENEYKISRREKHKIAQLCLSILSNETQKSVLILWSQNLRYNEIADRLDIPPGTVMSSLARARIKVAECIKDRLKNEK